MNKHANIKRFSLEAKIIQRFKKSWVVLLALLNSASSIIIAMMALLITIDVTARYLLNIPPPGTTELVKSSLAAIVFLSLGFTLLKGRHVRATIIFNALSPFMRNIVKTADSVLGMVVFGFMCRHSFTTAWTGWLIREYEGVQLRVPVYPVRFIIFLAAALVTIQFFIMFIQSAKELFSINKQVKL